MKILKTMLGDFKLTDEEAKVATEAMRAKGLFTSSRLGIAIQNHQMQAVLPFPAFPCDEVVWDRGVKIRRGNEWTEIATDCSFRTKLSGHEIPIDEALIKNLV